MFLGSDPCPQKYGLDLFSCAAQDSDHTACCKTKRVQRTSAGDKVNLFKIYKIFKFSTIICITLVSRIL